MKFERGNKVVVVEDQKRVVGEVLSGGACHGEEPQYFVGWEEEGFYNGFAESQLQLAP